MKNDDLGESSRQSDSDFNEERPFKKARYIWQLKGKYHMKNNHKRSENHTECRNSPINNAFQNERLEESAMINSSVYSTHSDNNCNNRCYVDSLLSCSDKLMEYDDSVEQETTSNNIDRAISEEIPVSLVQWSDSKDELLHRWQARQVAKSFVENTINTIFEQYNIAPYEVGDILENCENGEKVEDEGILMAIQSHGLQSNSGNSLFANQPTPTKYKHSLDDDLEASPSFVKLQQVEESTLDNYENVQNEIVKQHSIGDDNCDSEVDPVCISQNINQLDLGDPMDFLNTAVSVAIQKKGLSSYNYG